MQIQTTNLLLATRSTDEVLAWVDSLDEASRAEISPDWLTQLRAAPSFDPWTHGFVMMLRDTGTPVGSCAYKGPPNAEGMVEIAYGVDPGFRGRGYATEAARAMVDFAFASGRVRVVRAHTRLESAASMQILTKCGFEKIGEVIDPEDGLVLRWERRGGVA